jgi:hypothetical protein
VIYHAAVFKKNPKIILSEYKALLGGDLTNVLFATSIVYVKKLRLVEASRFAAGTQSFGCFFFVIRQTTGQHTPARVLAAKQERR